MDINSIPSSLATAIREIMNEIGAMAIDIREEKDGTPGGHELVIASGITGEMKGILMIKFNRRDAVSIANLMLKNIGQEHDSETITREHKEALSEIGNILSGRFVNIISENGIDSNLTPPSIITGSDIYGTSASLERAADFRVHGGSWSFDLSLGISCR